jgi:hypothetical protein
MAEYQKRHQAQAGEEPAGGTADAELTPPE